MMGHDVIVIGAGPAGMSAATTAAESGAKVLLLDDQPAPGGQIYRGIENAPKSRTDILGEDYLCGQSLAARFRRSGADYQPDTDVWQVTDEGEVGYSAEGRATLVRTPWIVIATGAMERPFPVQGWTLPGVMMAGAAQTLLKSSAIAAEGAVFAGCGPLLYLIVHQYLRAGISVAAVIDTTDRANRKRALLHIPAALSRWDLLAKGRRWMHEIKRSGTPVITGVTDLRICGEDAADGVAYRVGKGVWQEIASPHVFLHQGVVPNVNLSMSVGLTHDWDRRQLCWRPRTDEWGQASVDGIVIAGDGAGIHGALAAQAAGEISALGILCKAGQIAVPMRDQKAQVLRRILAKEQRIRPFLDAWFRPADHFRVPRDDGAIVCRCEELTFKDIVDTIDIGLAGPNQLKSFCRAGMGPCQGRFCGLTVQELIARETAQTAEAVGYYRLRPPIKPLLLEELANLQFSEMDDDAASKNC